MKLRIGDTVRNIRLPQSLWDYIDYYATEHYGIKPRSIVKSPLKQPRSIVKSPLKQKWIKKQTSAMRSRAIKDICKNQLNLWRPSAAGLSLRKLTTERNKRMNILLRLLLRNGIEFKFTLSKEQQADFNRYLKRGGSFFSPNDFKPRHYQSDSSAIRFIVTIESVLYPKDKANGDRGTVCTQGRKAAEKDDLEKPIISRPDLIGIGRMTNYFEIMNALLSM